MSIDPVDGIGIIAALGLFGVPGMLALCIWLDRKGNNNE